MTDTKRIIRPWPTEEQPDGSIPTVDPSDMSAEVRARLGAERAWKPVAQCRTDGRCQYAIDHGAEGLGHCPEGKCCMPGEHPDPEVARLREQVRVLREAGMAVFNVLRSTEVPGSPGSPLEMLRAALKETEGSCA